MLRLIERSEIVPLEKISACLNGQKPSSRPLEFARWLIKRGLITAFQAEQLMLGKSRGFFLGPYCVLEKLGDGATSDVFLCEHRHTGARVAIKVLSQQLASTNAGVLQRFRREARAAAALDHPNIVRTIDFDTADGQHFLVMEYVPGVTLDKWLKINPTALVCAHVRFILQASVGLQRLHESSVIHRDLKPTNLLLDRQGTVKILDLGLARFTDNRHDGLSTLEGANVMGTIDFMSPEQTNGHAKLDIRTDIFSLGATLYYLLTRGQVPFPAGGFGAKMIAIQLKQPKPISEFRPDVDPQLIKIVGRMMEKDPAKRFQTPKDLAAVLQDWLDRLDQKNDGRGEEAGSKTIPPAGGWLANKRLAMKWVFRVIVFLFVVWALVLFKPWNSRHRAAANAATATE